MASYVLYSPTEASHADATGLITHDAAIYEGDYDADGTTGDDPLGAIQNIHASGGHATGTGLGIGNDAMGSGANAAVHSLFRITLPPAPKTTASGDVINDANAVIKKVVLKFNVHSITGSPTNRRVAWAPMIRSPGSIDYSAVTWKTSDGSTDWAAPGAYGTGDRDTDTDYGSGVDGIAAFSSLDTGWNSVTLQNTMIVGPSSAQLVGFDWGSTVDIHGFPYNPTDLDSTDKCARIYSLEASGSSALIGYRPYVEVHYEDDPPDRAELTVTPAPDYRQALINISKKTEAPDLQRYILSWRFNSDPNYSASGSDGVGSYHSYGTTLTDTGKEDLHGFFDLFNNGTGNTNFFGGNAGVDGSSNHLTIWSEDYNNTGASGATKGSTLSYKRYQPVTVEDFDHANFAHSCSTSWILIGKHTGSNGASVLTDTGVATEPWLRGNFITNGVEAGDKVYNKTDLTGSTAGVATITGVTNNTITGTLSGGTDDDWDTNDEYVIVRKIDVGEKVSLTVRTTRVAGLQFDKIGVFWTNTAAGHISDDITSSVDDFDIIELDGATTEYTVSYRYTTPGTYYPNFFFVDANTGFRTTMRMMGNSNDPTSVAYVMNDHTRVPLVVEQPKPVPRVTSSKSIGESANVALDRNSAVIYSGANSTASGSDAYVKNYQWLGTYVSGQILTQGCLDIDNTPLVNESKKLYMRCNTAAYNASVFTIYGLASFQADNATSVKDTDTTFSHYRYVKATVSPGSAKYLAHNTSSAFGTAAVASGTASQLFFKQVDFIYCTTKSGTSGTEECYQLLAADSDNDGSIDASGVLDTSTVCKRLVIDSNNGSPGYKWGGLCSVTGSSNITFTKNSGADEIESTAVDFIAAGFGPGDTITVNDTLNDGVYTIQYIESVGGTHSMYLNEELTVTQASTSATIYTTQPTISVASSTAGTSTVSLNITDNLGVSGAAAVNINTTYRDQTYLDLNASADSGYIAIQNASLTRSGGISAVMPLGERRYPPGAVHTKHGLPKMSMTVRVVDITGFNRMYRLLNNSYNYAVYQHHDSAFATWVKYRLKLESFTINRDPQNLEHQIVSMSFFIVGEEV